MKKFLSVLLMFCMSSLWASTYLMPTSGTPIEYLLPPGEPLVVANQFYWTINAKCVVSSVAEENTLAVSFLRKTGTVNGQTLTEGDELNFILMNNEVLNIMAPPGSKVQLINLGSEEVRASCNAV